MSAIEILVLIGGLGLGYFVVSRLYDEMFGERRPPAPGKETEQKTPGAGDDTTDRRNT